MKPKFKTKWFYAALADTSTGYSNRFADYNEFSERLEEVYNQFDKDGYEVVNVLPIQMGQSDACTQRNGTYVGDVGFSITRGAVVVGKLRG
ncbi:hypothetical protein A4G18_00950 [Pasteurellaceae bacterium Pebbles2]|nr:hypothetical protein [Pasteurellaceae bacterium Pebbles2]